MYENLLHNSEIVWRYVNVGSILFCISMPYSHIGIEWISLFMNEILWELDNVWEERMICLNWMTNFIDDRWDIVWIKEDDFLWLCFSVTRSLKGFCCTVEINFQSLKTLFSGYGHGGTFLSIISVFHIKSYIIFRTRLKKIGGNFNRNARPSYLVFSR